MYSQRIVPSTVCNNGVSVNWRADWAQLQGKSYAQVLKSNIDVKSRTQVRVTPKVHGDNLGKKQTKHATFIRFAPNSPPAHTEVKKICQ